MLHPARLIAISLLLAASADAQFLTDGQVFYATDVTNNELLDLDETTGAAHTVGPYASPFLGGLAYDAATGRLYATDTANGDLVILDPASGATTVVGNTGIASPHGAAIDPADGTLYVCRYSSTPQLYKVNKTTGLATSLPGTLPAAIVSLAFDPTTGDLYGGDYFPTTIGELGRLFKINKASGVGTFVTTTGPPLEGIEFGDAGDLYAVSAGGLWRVDKQTGSSTLIGIVPGTNLRGLAFCAGCAEVDPLGCGVNPAGSLTIGTGMPALGATLQLVLDNPLATQAPGSAVFLALASAASSAYPCGALVPGFGMAGGGAPGELLLSVAAPNPFAVIAGPTWGGVGFPSAISLNVPVMPPLVGVRVYVQGLVVDATPGALVPFALTDGAELLIGG